MTTNSNCYNKHSFTSTPSTLIVDGEFLNDQVDVINALNEHFCNTSDVV